MASLLPGLKCRAGLGAATCHHHRGGISTRKTQRFDAFCLLTFGTLTNKHGLRMFVGDASILVDKSKQNVVVGDSMDLTNDPWQCFVVKLTKRQTSALALWGEGKSVSFR